MENREYTKEEARAIYLASAWFLSLMLAFMAGGGIVYLLMK